MRVGHLAVLLQARRPAWRWGSCRRPGAWHEMFWATHWFQRWPGRGVSSACCRAALSQASGT